MFEITIKGETMGELTSNVMDLAATFDTRVGKAVANQRSYEADDAAREEMQAKRTRKKAEPAPEPEVVDAVATERNPDDDDTPPEPMPEGAAQVVDAGTGKPQGAALNEPVEEPVRQMTFDDVKAAAAKLAAKDMAKLAGILKKYDAPNLSGVPKDQLGDFAGDVMEALEALEALG